MRYYAVIDTNVVVSAMLNTLVTGLIKRAVFVNAEPVEELLPDSKDIVFYEVVMEGRKSENAYLVTGNKNHFPIKPFIVDSRQMIEIIEKDRIPEEDLG